MHADINDEAVVAARLEAIATRDAEWATALFGEGDSQLKQLASSPQIASNFYRAGQELNSLMIANLVNKHTKEKERRKYYKAMLDEIRDLLVRITKQPEPIALSSPKKPSRQLQDGMAGLALRLGESAVGIDLAFSVTRSRWVFTPQELDEPKKCAAHDEFIGHMSREEAKAGGYCEEAYCDLGILLQRDGTPTNRFADGTKGINEEAGELIAGTDCYATDDGQYADTWRDVYVYVTTGEFAAFA